MFRGEFSPTLFLASHFTWQEPTLGLQMQAVKSGFLT